MPPEQQRLILQCKGDGAGAEGCAGGDGALVAEGADPSDTVWSAGARAGMRLLLVATDAPAAVGEGTWSVEQVVGLRREGLESEVARVKKRVIFIVVLVRLVALVPVALALVGVGVVVSFGGFGADVATKRRRRSDVENAIGAIVAVGSVVATVVVLAVGFPERLSGFAGNFVAALEGRDYVPPPHTRGWMGS